MTTYFFDELFVQQPSGAYKQRAKTQPVAIGYVLQIYRLLGNNGIFDRSTRKPMMGGSLSGHFERQRLVEQKRHIVNGTVPVLYF